MKYNAQEVFNFFNELSTPRTDKRQFEIEIFRHLEFELREVSVDDLDPGYTDNDRLEQYQELTTEPPPILLNSRMKIIDGFHRVKAQKQKKLPTIMAFIPLGEPLY